MAKIADATPPPTSNAPASRIRSGNIDTLLEWMNIMIRCRANKCSLHTSIVPDGDYRGVAISLRGSYTFDCVAAEPCLQDSLPERCLCYTTGVGPDESTAAERSLVDCTGSSCGSAADAVADVGDLRCKDARCGPWRPGRMKPHHQA